MTQKRERVLIVTVQTRDETIPLEDRQLELRELVRTTGAEVVAEAVQTVDSIHPKYFMGSGKAEELADFVKDNDVDTVIINDELTGSQMRNLEEIIDCKIVDRTGLILDIFALRARTREAKLQVKLAQLEYRLPRLVGFRNYLSREGAGIGTRGPGEQKLETDRRTITREIASIKSALKELKQKRKTTQKQRVQSGIPMVALIGYSNAGKSTIMNQLLSQSGEAEKEVYADDRLFATLDPSVRRVQPEDAPPYLLSDTVGFVSNLPTKLVASFRSTLEEIENADLLLFIIDSSSIRHKEQMKATLDVLKDMDLTDKEMLYVFNKRDLAPDVRSDENPEQSIYLCAKDEQDIQRLSDRITDLLFGEKKEYELEIPYADFHVLSELNDKGRVLDEKHTQEGARLKVVLRDAERSKYRKYEVS